MLSGFRKLQEWFSGVGCRALRRISACSVQSGHDAVIVFGPDGRVRHLDGQGRAILSFLKIEPDKGFALNRLLWRLGVPPDELCALCPGRLCRTCPRACAMARAAKGKDSAKPGGLRVEVACGPDYYLLLGQVSEGVVKLVFVDIAQMRRQQNHFQRAMQQNRRLAAALDATSSMVVMVDPKMEGSPIVFANEAVKDILGWRGEDLMGQNWRILLDRDTPEADVVRMREAVAHEQAFAGEVRLQRQDGKTFWGEVTLAPVYNEYGRLDLFVAIGRNISDRVASRKRDQQMQKLEVLGQLSGGLAHEYNNILSIIEGYASMVSERAGLHADTKAAIGHILSASHRAIGLTRQLLGFSRRRGEERQMVDVSGFLADQETLLSPLLGASIRLECRFPDRKPMVFCNQDLLGQAIMNMVINSRDAMPEGGHIAIEVSSCLFAAIPHGAIGRREMWRMRDRFVAVCVKDDGCGMTDEVLRHLSEPFFTTKPEGRGTGLGMALVFSVAASMNGFIHIESAPGKGTAITLFLPEKEGQFVAAESSSEVASLRGKTILLVDDEAEILDLLRQQMEAAGAEVLLAGDGDAALAVQEAHEGRIDAMFCDMVMPGIGGQKLAELVQAVRPETGIVFMSGGEVQGMVGMKGRYAILSKPFRPAEMAQALGLVLRDERQNGTYSRR